MADGTGRHDVGDSVKGECLDLEVFADGDGKLNDEERLKLTQDPEIQNMFKRMLNTNRTPRGGGDNPPPPPPPPDRGR